MLHYNGFCYHFHSFNRDRSKSYRRCEERRICNARCMTSQDSDNITVIQNGTGKHQHNVGVEGEVRKTLNRLKWQTEAEPNATSLYILWTPLGILMRKRFRYIILPKRTSLKRQIHRIQNRHWPPNPTSLHGIEIPEEYKVTGYGELFLMHDSGAWNGERILIHTTYDSIRYLSASTSFSDGTFKMAPT